MPLEIPTIVLCKADQAQSHQVSDERQVDSGIDAVVRGVGVVRVRAFAFAQPSKPERSGCCVMSRTVPPIERAP